MRAAPASGWRMAGLLIRLRARRMLNLWGSSFSRRRKKARSGTRTKRVGSLLLTIPLALLLAGVYANLAHQGIGQLSLAVSDPAVGVDRPFGMALAHVLATEVAVLMLAALMAAVGSRELTNADWDLEWLVTFPAEVGTLLWSRVAERTVTNPFGALAIWPTCAALAWAAGWRWAAVPLGLLAALPLLAMLAMLQTVVDTGLRLRLQPARLRNLHALMSVSGVMVMYLAISPGMPGGARYLIGLAGWTPDALRWTPPGLVVEALGATHPAEALLAASLLVVEVALLLWLGMACLSRWLAQGIVAAGARESARTRQPATAARPPQAASSGWMPASPVHRRELTLLLRDRNFLAQTLVLPVLIVGMQWFIQGRPGSLEDWWDSPRQVAATLFAVISYALMMSALQTLATEGQALWMLFTFPASIERVLWDKARLWASLVLVYPLIGFTALLILGPSPGWSTLGLAAMVLVAVPVFSVIGVALGVFGSNPLAEDNRQRMKPTVVYLFMLLAGLYGYGLFAPRWWQSLVIVVLITLLAQALWQKARDHLPYLLDPVAGPAPRVSAADGLIAAMIFFTVQVMVGAILVWAKVPIGGAQLLLAFGVAGAVTTLGVRFTQWRARVQGLPALVGPQGWRSLGTGLVWGLLAAGAGVVYLQLMQRGGWLEGELGNELRLRSTALGPWIYPLAILAAPLFEEYIFRGLLFAGLRRSMRLWPAAIASAALFAIVHPPLSMTPVGVLGLCTALAYERSRGLLAPMVAHAVYNALVIGWSVWMLGAGP